MIKDFSITNMGMDLMAGRNEKVVMTYDNVVQIIDVPLYNNVLRTLSPDNPMYDLFNFDKYKNYDEDAIQPIIFDRTEKNLIKWALKPEFRDNYDCELLYKSLLTQYGEQIYNNAEFSETASSIPIILQQKNLSRIHIVMDELNSKVKTQRLVDLLGPYAYRIQVHILDEPLVEYMLRELNDFTLLFHDDASIITDLKDKGMDLSEKCFAISNLSYNFHFDETTEMIAANVDVFRLIDECGVGIGYVDLKRFSDDKYFRMG